MASKSHFKIKNIELSSPFILAPMAAVNCQAFRRMCFEHGAGLVYSGMIDADELASDTEKSRRKYFDFSGKEGVISVQLIGGKKESLAKAAELLSAEKNVSIIELNAGCILGEWLGRKAGAYLIKHPEMLEKLVRTLVENSTKPVACKIRIGWDAPAHKLIAKIVEDAGASAIAVHARTKKQGYACTAKWNAIKEVKETVSIPVIGNGDITSPEKAKQLLGQTKCDAIMVGRWAVGNPYCFKQLSDYFEGGQYKKLNHELKAELQKREFLRFMQYYEEQPRQKLSELKQHAKWFVKGALNQAMLQRKIDECVNRDRLREYFE